MMGNTLVTTTDTDGNYRYISENTRANYAGDQLHFTKPGYETEYAGVFSESEAGSELCGEVHLMRDAVLTP